MTTDPTPEHEHEHEHEQLHLDDDQRRQFQDAAAMMRAAGKDAEADDLDAFVVAADAGQLSRPDVERRLNAIMANLLDMIPGDFAAALAHPDLDAQLAELDSPPAPEQLEAPQEAPGAPEPAPDLAGAQLAQQLAQAGLEGRYVVLTPEQAVDLADLAAFAGYAREAVYPVIVALQPLVQRLGTMGDQLQNAGPAGIVQLLTGSFSQKG